MPNIRINYFATRKAAEDALDLLPEEPGVTYHVEPANDRATADWPDAHIISIRGPGDARAIHADPEPYRLEDARSNLLQRTRLRQNPRPASTPYGEGMTRHERDLDNDYLKRRV